MINYNPFKPQFSINDGTFIFGGFPAVKHHHKQQSAKTVLR
jgi:hypothetical protein